MPRFQEPSIEENVFTPIATQRWPRKLVLMLCGLLLSLAILEMGARTYAWLTSQERTVIADDLLGWKLVPRAKHLYRKEEQAYLIAINSKGLRDTEHSYDKPTGVFRIVVVGDSFVFGSGGVETSDRFTDILEKSTKNIEVINMGVPAYGSDQEYLFENGRSEISPRSDYPLCLRERLSRKLFHSESVEWSPEGIFFSQWRPTGLPSTLFLAFLQARATELYLRIHGSRVDEAF